jgi:hypothetical protein
MPVAGVKCGKRPDYILTRKTLVDMNVFGNVSFVIQNDKRIISDRPV